MRQAETGEQETTSTQEILGDHCRESRCSQSQKRLSGHCATSGRKEQQG